MAKEDHPRRSNNASEITKRKNKDRGNLPAYLPLITAKMVNASSLRKVNSEKKAAAAAL
jgi:hypothetical protein